MDLEDRYTPEEIEQGLDVMRQMCEDTHDIGTKVIEIMRDLGAKYPKEEINFMKNDIAEKFEIDPNDEVIVSLNQIVKDILTLTNKIREKIEGEEEI